MEKRNTSSLKLLESPGVANQQISPKYGIIKEETDRYKEAETVSREEQATMRDLTNLEEKFDLKIKGTEDRLSAKIDLMNSEISGKINSLTLEMKNMLLEEREEQKKQKQETNRFLIGTLLLGGLGLLVSVISIFL